MPPKRASRRQQTTPRVASAEQTQHATNAIPQEAAADQEMAIINEILSQQPAAYAHVKQSLISLGFWPHDRTGSFSSSSSDWANGDSSGAMVESSGSSGERRATSTTSSRGEGETRCADSDDTAEARAKGSNFDGSRSATRSSGAVESSAASSGDRPALSVSSSMEERQGSTGPTLGKSAWASDGSTLAGSGGPTDDWLHSQARHKGSLCGGSDASPEAKDGDDSECSSKGKDSEDPSNDSGTRQVPDLSVHGMDCLPRDAVVWVEGEDCPKEICELKGGDNVLCFDCLGRSVRYAEVVGVRQDDEPVQWVAMELADGTKTILTADHPVQLAGTHALQAVVKARDIEPQKSRIMVHRVTTEPVPVSSVVPLPLGLALPSGRVSVTVQQGDRNAILVASPQQGRADAQFVAVGSADLAPQPFGVLRRFTRDTELPCSPEENCRRSHSWPPSVGRRWELPLAAAGRVLQLPATRGQGSSSFGTASDSSSFQESCSDTSSEGETQVLLPWNLPGQPILGGSADLGRVSKLLQAKAEHWPSVGSAGHATRTCRPCYFAHKNRCSAGIWCPRCHNRHTKTNGRLSCPR